MIKIPHIKWKLPAQTIIAHIFFSLFLFLITLGQLQRIQVTPNIAVYLHDPLLVLWCVWAIGSHTQLRQKLISYLKKITQRKETIFLMWITIGLVISLLRGGNILPAIFYFMRLALYASFGFVLFEQVQYRLISRASILLGFFLYGIFILYFGLLQYFVMPDTRWLFFLGWDDHYYRLISTLLDPGFTGIILVLAFCLLQSLERRFIQRSHYKEFLQPIFQRVGSCNMWVIKIVLSLLFCVGILLTYSRATYCAFLVTLVMGAFFYFRQKGKMKNALMYVLYIAVFLFALPLLPHPGGEGVKLDRTASVYARTTSIRSTLQNMQPLDWIIGEGLFVQEFKSTTAYQQPNHAHIPDNWIIFILSGTGLLGLAMFLYISWEVLIELYRKNVWLAISLAIVFIHGLFNASVVYPFVLLFLIGFVVALEEY
jgi:hypothetical protein